MRWSCRATIPIVKIQKLDTVDAFIVLDLDDAEASAGVVRLAPKILRDGARTMARSLTYRFASFGLKVGGASVGINAQKDKRADALEAFVTEISTMTDGRRLLVDPGKGVGVDDLAPLRVGDVRSPLYWSEGPGLTALGLAHSAQTVVGSLSGCSVAIEGFDSTGPTLARELTAGGAKVVCIGTPMGTVVDPTGIESGALQAAWDEHGTALVDHLDGEVKSPGAVIDMGADVLFVGSKLGIVDHVEAPLVEARVIVPSGPAPVTAKGLAVLRKADITVLPDFITTAGALFAAFPPDGRTAADLRETVSRRIPEALREVLDHPDGAYLGACERAEEFLTTWQSSLPFGRPLA